MKKKFFFLPLVLFIHIDCFELLSYEDISCTGVCLLFSIMGLDGTSSSKLQKIQKTTTVVTQNNPQTLL